MRKYKVKYHKRKWKKPALLFAYGFVLIHLATVINSIPITSKAQITSNDSAIHSTQLLIAPEYAEIVSEIEYSMMTPEQREDAVKEYLSLKFDDESVVDTFVQIGKLESSLRPDALPPVFVKHCQKSTGGFYVVELVNRNGLNVQADCYAGDTEVHREKSYGIFQILPSTAKRSGCKADLTYWKDQVDCAVNVYERSGFNAWSTYKLINK